MEISYIKKKKNSEILENSKRHLELEILLLKSGEACIETENFKFNLQKDDVFIVNIGATHTLTSKPNHAEILSLLIPSSFIEYDFEQAYFESPLKDKKLVPMILEIEREHSHKSLKSQLKSKALVCDLLFYLLQEKKFHLLENKKKQTKNPYTEKMEELFEYVRQNFTNDITLESLAKHTNYSKSWLWRAFQFTTGLSPMNYIKSVRLEHAKMLLDTSNLSVTEIAFQSGFPDLNSFFHMFAKEYDISPQKYRLKSKE